MIQQDGAARKAAARNTDTLTIPGQRFTDTYSDRILVVCFAAKGQGMKNSTTPSVSYGGVNMSLAARGDGLIGSQFGGVWIYTLAGPYDARNVEINFQGAMAEQIAAVSAVFHGVDQSKPIGQSRGDFGSSPDSMTMWASSPGSRFISSIVGGSGEENRFVESEILAAMEAGEMSMNVAITDSPGEDVELDFNISDGSSRNAIAVVELMPAQTQTGQNVVVTEIMFNEKRAAVAEGTTGDNGAEITGEFGTLTMGADGSYDYVADQPAAGSLSPDAQVTEIFTYVLSNGGEISTHELPVPVNGSANEEGPREAPAEMEQEEPAEEEPGELAVTKIRFEEGPPLEVINGTTSENGTAIDGKYGTLTIGSDGSYSYLAGKDEAHRLSPTETVHEEFSYVLSNGRESAVAKLSVEVEGLDREEQPVSEDGTDRIFEIVEIKAGNGVSFPVVSGSTALSGGTNISGNFGTLTIGADGSYEYVVGKSLSTSPEQAPVETFTYTISDGVSVDTQVMTISVTLPEEEFADEEIPVHQEPAADSPQLESLVYQISFESDVEDVGIEDFELVGAEGGSIREISKVSDRVYDLTIEGPDLRKHQDSIQVTYVAAPKVSDRKEMETEWPVPVEDPPADHSAVPEESAIPELPEEEVSEETGTMAESVPASSEHELEPQSFSDLGNTQYTSEVDVPDQVETIMESAPPPEPTMTHSDLDGPARDVIKPQRIAPVGFPFLKNKAPTTALPLEGITKLFKDPEDKRFFGGVRILKGEEQGSPEISYVPYFAGAASPGATIGITIRNSLGIEVATTSIVADLSGYWTASPEMDMDETQYTIAIEETPATWEGTSFPARAMAAQIIGGLPAEEETVRTLAHGQIVGGIIKGRSMEEFMSGLMDMPDNSFMDESK